MEATLTHPGVDTPSHAGHAHSCLNCGQAVPERFCSRCGQDAHHTHRITMAHMLHDIPHSVWHVDKGIIYTLRTTLLQPGPTIRAYLAGQRIDHFRPLSLLLVVTGVYALLASVLNLQLLAPIGPEESPAVRQMQETFVNFFTKYMGWVYVATLPIVAAYARLFLRRGGYNYAECLIIAAFITSMCNFLALVFLPVTAWASRNGLFQQVSLPLMVLTVGYATWAYASLLRHTNLRPLGRLLRGFLTFALSYVTYITMGVVLVYALNWSVFLEAVKQEKARAEAAKTTPAAPRAPQQR